MNPGLKRDDNPCSAPGRMTAAGNFDSHSFLIAVLRGLRAVLLKTIQAYQAQGCHCLHAARNDPTAAPARPTHDGLDGTALTLQRDHLLPAFHRRPRTPGSRAVLELEVATHFVLTGSE